MNSLISILPSIENFAQSDSDISTLFDCFQQKSFKQLPYLIPRLSLKIGISYLSCILFIYLSYSICFILSYLIPGVGIYIGYIFSLDLLEKIRKYKRE